MFSLRDAQSRLVIHLTVELLNRVFDYLEQVTGGEIELIAAIP